jgi:hypothetical protein
MNFRARLVLEPCVSYGRSSLYMLYTPYARPWRNIQCKHSSHSRGRRIAGRARKGSGRCGIRCLPRCAVGAGRGKRGDGELPAVEGAGGDVRWERGERLLVVVSEETG